MSLLNTDDTVCLIVDIQERLLPITFNNEILIKKAGIWAKAINILQLPYFITEQYPKGLGKTINEIKQNLKDDNNYYEKVSFSALYNNELIKNLKNTNKTNVIISGIETHICVFQTAMHLKSEGFNVTILKDCCGSRNKDEHDNALSILDKNNTSIKTLEMVLFELIKTSRHEKFKEIQNLIK